MKLRHEDREINQDGLEVLRNASGFQTDVRLFTCILLYIKLRVQSLNVVVHKLASLHCIFSYPKVGSNQTETDRTCCMGSCWLVCHRRIFLLPQRKGQPAQIDAKQERWSPCRPTNVHRSRLQDVAPTRDLHSVEAIEQQ
jgi:hypothetical protein